MRAEARQPPNAQGVGAARPPVLSPVASGGVASPRLEAEADQVAARLVQGRGRAAAPPGGTGDDGSNGNLVQHFSLAELAQQGAAALGGAGAALGAAVGAAGQAVGAAAGVVAAATGLTTSVLVGDEATPEPGQMRRADFVHRLDATIRAVADAELAELGRSTEDCPYLQQWLGWARSQPTSLLEVAAQRYCQPAEQTADAYLTAVASRVRSGVASWKRTGSLADVPAALPGGLSSEIVQHKAAGTGATAAADARGVRARLGPGAALPTGVRGRMERGFGVSFAGVRVHTDPAAAAVTRELGSLALTAGQDVAFSAGTFRPGTLEGDALLAHELAHTVQQRGGSAAAGSSGALEQEADIAAAATLGLTPDRHQLSSGQGLRVQSCKPTRKECPPGMMWGTVAQPASGGAGSFGCSCAYRCVPNPSMQPEGPQLCGPNGCPTVEIVGDEYRFERAGEVQTAPVNERAGLDERALGWGASATPLGAQAVCLCPGVDIEGKERSEGSHLSPIVTDATDLAGMGGRVRRDPRTGLPTGPGPGAPRPPTSPPTNRRAPVTQRPPEAPRPTAGRGTEDGPPATRPAANRVVEPPVAPRTFAEPGTRPLRNADNAPELARRHGIPLDEAQVLAESLHRSTTDPSVAPTVGESAIARQYGVRRGDHQLPEFTYTRRGGGLAAAEVKNQNEPDAGHAVRKFTDIAALQADALASGQSSARFDRFDLYVPSRATSFADRNHGVSADGFLTFMGEVVRIPDPSRPPDHPGIPVHVVVRDLDPQ